MKVQVKQANEKYPVPKHLFTNVEFKVKPHKIKTKFLQARTDTCTDVNLMPVGMYKYLFKDTDCAKIVPSYIQLGTYSNKSVKSLDLATYMLSIQIQDVWKKYHFLWPAVKAVSWSHAQLVLH